MSASLFEPQLFADDTGKLLPLALEDELFILERANVSFQTKAPTRETYKSKGRVYCTTQRIIFVAEKPSTQHDRVFNAFEIPLADMSDEKFNQPIFGACSISGIVLAPEADGSGKFAWKVIFSNGGTGVVLPVFLRLLEKREKQETIDMTFVHSQNKAFVDPNDPTVIYIAQPVKPAGKAPL